MEREPDKVTAHQYAQICDVIERAWHRHKLGDDGMLHTSADARADALKILQILGLEVELYIMPAENLKRAAAYIARGAPGEQGETQQ